MTGTKKARTALGNRFKKGMFPTEDDFADVFESYVHKDDDIQASKVVITDGDGNTTTISNELSKKADASSLDGILTRLKAAEDDIDAAQDDIAANSDNIAGHETRIKTLETSKSDYEAFKDRVRAFLEDADASDDTINRWHEIETFLQGITDTESLTGLLADLKQEILAAVPTPQSGSYLKLIPDLDAYTNAHDGEIVKYVGPTNAKYTRGFDYERVGGDAQTITTSKYLVFQNQDKQYYFTGNVIDVPFYLDRTTGVSGYFFGNFDNAQLYSTSGGSWTISSINEVDNTILVVGKENYPCPIYRYDSYMEFISEDGERILHKQTLEGFNTCSGMQGASLVFFTNNKVWATNAGCSYYKEDSPLSVTIGTPSSWQLLPASPVIS